MGEKTFFHYRDLEDQYQSFLGLQKRFPDSLAVVRYEDMVRSPMDMAKKVLRHLGTNKTGLIIVIHFNIRGKLNIIRCDK